MGWSRPSLIAIVILLTHEVLSNLNELIVVRHPPTANGSTRKLTCLSEDDGSALIWNYEPEKWEENTLTNFKPAEAMTKGVKDCAVRNLTTCIAEWDRYGGWNVVNSFKNPMGPVFDYRWEGFKEFSFEKSVDEEEYQYVGEMKQSSHSSVFSFRGSRHVNIFLCRKRNMMAGPCVWINIGGQEGKQSTIQVCKGGAPSARAKESAGCEPMTVEKHDKNIINKYEWRTFRVKWISDESTIEVYDETQNSPFLYKVIEPRQQSLGHVSIGSDRTTRIRFHSYDYFLTTKRTKKISTKKFRYYNNFCIEILFGVCKKCEIIVDMMGDRDNLLKTVKITGDETCELDGMMTWNLVKIDLSLRNFTSQDVKLEMRSGSCDSNSYKGNDQWAIGGLRTCKSGGSLRASSITVRRKLRSYSAGEWPKTNCQKLSYDKSKSTVVDSFPTNSSLSCSDDRIWQFTRKLHEACSSWCEKFEEKSSVCKPIGCSCAYGFMGINCDEECAEQPRKYNRTERSSSRSEYYGTENPTDDNYECPNDMFLPPSCEKVNSQSQHWIQTIINQLTRTAFFTIRAKTGNIEKLSESQNIWYTVENSSVSVWSKDSKRFGVNILNNAGMTVIYTNQGVGYRWGNIEVLQAPTATIFSYNQASFSLTVELEGDAKLNSIDFVITVTGGSSSSSIWNRAFRSDFTASTSKWQSNVTDLLPDAKYQVYAVAYVKIKNGGSIRVNGRKRAFTSTPWGARCYGIKSVTRTSLAIFVRTESEVEGCGTSAPTRRDLGMKKSTETAYEWKYGAPLPFTFTDLEANTEYQVIVVVHGFGTVYHNSVETFESAPGRVTYLHMTSVTDTQAIIKWLPPARGSREGIAYEVSIKRDSLFGCKDKNIPELTQNEGPVRVDSAKYIVKDLHPYASYTASVTAVTSQRGEAEVMSFQTQETSLPRSVVSKLIVDVKNLGVEWDEPEDCSTITSRIAGTKLTLKSIGHSDLLVVPMDRLIWIPNKYSDIPELPPYKDYELRAYVVATNNRVNYTAYTETQFRTPPSAPGAVRNLRIYDADYDTNSISLRWRPPNPPGGEIQSCHVLIEQHEMLLMNSSIEPLKHKCKFQINCVCLTNLQLSRDLSNDIEVQVQVWAKNKDVEKNGVRETLRFLPNHIYNRKPGMPMNFTAIHQYQGVVLIKWMPLRFPATKVTSFEIYVEVLEKHLRNNTYDQFPMKLNYTVGNKKIEYSQELPLLPSTKYRASIVSKNRRRNCSDLSEIEFSIPGSLGFAGQEEPELKNNASLIALKIPEVVNATTNTTLKVFVEGPSKCTRHDSSPEQNLIEIVGEWLAAEFTVDNNLPIVLEISAEQHHGVELDCSLRRNEIYTILFIVKDWISNNTDKFETSKITLTVSRGSSIGMILGLLVIFIVIAICLIIFFGCYRKHKRSPNKLEEPIYLDILPPIPSMGDVNSTSGLSEARVYSIPNEPDSHAVSIEYFEEYTKRAAASGQLYSQFMLLRSGMIKPGETGMLPENIPKNRYRNLIAYDDTRVVLDKIPGDSHSDYINASYIRGYRKERAYIATQGPKLNTINDFWRMIWQEDVRVICMMSNVVEGVTQYSVKYWPDLGSRIKYGNIFISNTNQQVFADFTFRKFRLSCYGDTREVTHLQYTGWPVLGMPSAQSFVVFLKKLVQTPSGDGPIVVHCHAGDGRSGIIILCDISLRQAIGESTIDATAVTTRMRDSRANMVATPQQYLFAHIAIVESLMSIPTQLPCTEIFTSRLQKMKLQLIADLQRLEYTMWQEQALDAFATQEPSTAEYTTIDDIAPDISEVADFDRSKPFDRRSSGFDVVSVDGLKLKNQYLASWLPPPLTLARFWKFVVEENIQLIVILQCSDPKNTKCSDIIPDELILPSMPNMTVEPKTVPERGEYFTSETLLLRDTSEKITASRTVTVLTCEGWQSGEFGKPPAPVALVSLWRASEKIPRREAETLVLCNNGSSACGLYLAMCLLLERMAVEGECDVISAVRTVRKSNPGFVPSKNHCEYLYDAAEVYAEYFKCYANFN